MPEDGLSENDVIPVDAEFSYWLVPYKTACESIPRSSIKSIEEVDRGNV